jgi:hypothetical protein
MADNSPARSTNNQKIERTTSNLKRPPRSSSVALLVMDSLNEPKHKHVLDGRTDSVSAEIACIEGRDLGTFSRRSIGVTVFSRHASEPTPWDRKP